MLIHEHNINIDKTNTWTCIRGHRHNFILLDQKSGQFIQAFLLVCHDIRDRSLIMGRAGYKRCLCVWGGGGGQVKFYPTKRGGVARKRFMRHLRGGAKFLSSFNVGV